ncbi:transcriptional coactivator p15/PC4 family protein [Methylorubrum extorquens]|uniref:transcriptional coactivator p15/PC4 family protein n=1 Tax=Methylorubrum extorquens TaxID=408 RepID=UPI001EE55BD8|nr:transcriptional coactivator p15/PC4 family protein [Methylorubrum extorquens]MCG5246008.1 transcriptional coactivator p15/PC4 family protein [Methylorubrum extorquens]
MSDLRTVATVRKNNTEEIRVSVAEREGYTLVDLRVFAASPRGRGEPHATKAGICVVRDRLPALIEALQAAEREVSR